MSLFHTSSGEPAFDKLEAEQFLADQNLQQIAHVAKGGNSHVFYIRDDGETRTAKVMLREHAEREESILSKITSPAVIRMIKSIKPADKKYGCIVFPKVNPQAFHDLIISGKKRFKNWPGNKHAIITCLESVLWICEGLSRMHSKGIPHRDLKPGNIAMVIPQDETEIQPSSVIPNSQAIILDLGQAGSTFPKNGNGRKANVTSSMHETEGYDAVETAKLELGTIRYRPPELSGEQRRLTPELGAPDQRVDIYGLGCILFSLLSGVHPVTGETESSETVCSSIAHELKTGLVEQEKKWFARLKELKKPEAKMEWLFGDLSRSPVHLLGWIAAKAMAYDPNERFQDIGDFENAVRWFLFWERTTQQAENGLKPIPGYAKPWPLRRRHFIQRNWLWLSVAAAGFAISVLGVALWLYRGASTERAVNEKLKKEHIAFFEEDFYRSAFTENKTKEPLETKIQRLKQQLEFTNQKIPNSDVNLFINITLCLTRSNLALTNQDFDESSTNLAQARALAAKINRVSRPLEYALIMARIEISHSKHLEYNGQFEPAIAKIDSAKTYLKEIQSLATTKESANGIDVADLLIGCELKAANLYFALRNFDKALESFPNSQLESLPSQFPTSLSNQDRIQLALLATMRGEKSAEQYTQGGSYENFRAATKWYDMAASLWLPEFYFSDDLAQLQNVFGFEERWFAFHLFQAGDITKAEEHLARMRLIGQRYDSAGGNQVRSLVFAAATLLHQAEFETAKASNSNADFYYQQVLEIGLPSIKSFEVEKSTLADHKVELVSRVLLARYMQGEIARRLGDVDKAKQKYQDIDFVKYTVESLTESERISQYPMIALRLDRCRQKIKICDATLALNGELQPDAFYSDKTNWDVATQQAVVFASKGELDKTVHILQLLKVAYADDASQLYQLVISAGECILAFRNQFPVIRNNTDGQQIDAIMEMGLDLLSIMPKAEINQGDLFSLYGFGAYRNEQKFKDFVADLDKSHSD